MRLGTIGFGLVFAVGLLTGSTWQARAAQTRSDPACGAASMPQVRTTLYFGTARPKGSVSERPRVTPCRP